MCVMDNLTHQSPVILIVSAYRSTELEQQNDCMRTESCQSLSAAAAAPPQRAWTTFPLRSQSVGSLSKHNSKKSAVPTSTTARTIISLAEARLPSFKQKSASSPRNCWRSNNLTVVLLNSLLVVLVLWTCLCIIPLWSRASDVEHADFATVPLVVPERTEPPQKIAGSEGGLNVVVAQLQRSVQYNGGVLDVVELSRHHVEPTSNVTAAVCFKTLFGDIDLGLVLQWVGTYFVS